MIRLLTLLLALTLFISPLAGGHVVASDSASDGIHGMQTSLRGEPRQDVERSSEHDQSEKYCSEFLIDCKLDMAHRTVDRMLAKDYVSIGKYFSNSDHRDSIKFLAEPPPPRT